MEQLKDFDFFFIPKPFAKDIYWQDICSLELGL